MSDERLRRLERVWEESGDPGDGARYLLERVRLGDLQRERLTLAAYLGHAPARLALRDEGAPDPAEDPEPWMRGLARWGKEPVVRVAVAAARLVLPVYERSHLDDRRPREGIEAAAAWCGCPCGEHAAAVDEPARRAYEAYLQVRPAEGQSAVACAADAARFAAEVADPVHAHFDLSSLENDETKITASGLQVAINALDRSLRALAIDADVGRTRFWVVPGRRYRDQLLDHVRGELLPWVLGGQGGRRRSRARR